MIDRLEKEVEMLHRHLEILQLVISSEPIGIVKMSNETGLQHHKIRYSLRVLEEGGLIAPSSQGAICTENTEAFVESLGSKLDDIRSSLNSLGISSSDDS
ncbi:MAG: hypothetical protein MK159_02395 [Halobacteriales archaeon]|nr:hypothetical protein [Halobacteriales archaeon]